MAVADPPQAHSAAAASAAAESAQALTGFISALWALNSVKRLGVSQDRGKFDFWVLMAEEVLPEAERVFRVHREFRESARVFPFSLHVVPLSEVDEASLPPLQILFER
jgi:hypothetical protein